MTQPTARDDIRVPIGLAFAMANQPMSSVDELLDEYEAAHRNEVLTEAAEKLAEMAGLAPASPRARGLRFAAGVLDGLRIDAAPAERPVVLCELPHPVAADTWCALRIEHDGWHQDAAGTRWPNAILAARTETPQEN